MAEFGFAPRDDRSSKSEPNRADTDGATTVSKKMLGRSLARVPRRSPAGRVGRACRRFRLAPGDAKADLSLRRVNINVRDISLIAAVVDPDTAALAARAGGVPSPTLVKMDLRTCGLDGAMLARLAACLPCNVHLAALDLSGNDFADGVRLLAAADPNRVAEDAKASSTSAEAYAYRAGFGLLAAAAASREEADVGDGGPRLPPNVGLAALGEALETNVGLTSINLSESHVEAQGLAALARGLRRNASLLELKLARNEVCDVSPQGWGAFSARGVLALGDALRVNATLQRLDLQRNQLCGVTAPWVVGKRGTFVSLALLAFKPALVNNEVLRELNLTDNGILEAGGRPIITELAAARGQGGADFRLSERLGKAKRHYCILRRAAWYQQAQAASKE